MKFSPYALENLFNRLGQPAWFYPLVFFILFVVLPLAQSAFEVELQ